MQVLIRRQILLDFIIKLGYISINLKKIKAIIS